jgi:hypothetical protein
VTGRVGPRIPPRHRLRRGAGSARSFPSEPPLGTRQIRDRITETSVSATSHGPDQRNGRDDCLVFLAPPLLGGALLLAMFLFVAPAVFLAAPFFFAPF